MKVLERLPPLPAPSKWEPKSTTLRYPVPEAFHCVRRVQTPTCTVFPVRMRFSKIVDLLSSFSNSISFENKSGTIAIYIACIKSEIQQKAFCKKHYSDTHENNYIQI